MAIKDTGPWVALAFSYIHISTGNSNLKEYLEISFWWKSNILPYFPTKAPWFQLYRGADFPTDRGCQDFDGQTSTVSHEIFRVHLSPFTYISANKGSSLVFSFSFIHDEVMTDVLWKVSSYTHERFLPDIDWSFATCSLYEFRELLNYSFVGKVCHARVEEAKMQKKLNRYFYSTKYSTNLRVIFVLLLFGFPSSKTYLCLALLEQ